MFGRLLGWYTIYTVFGEGRLPLTEFCYVQNSLCVQVLRYPIYWQRYCMALEESAKLCGVVSSRDRAAIPFDIGQSNCLVLDVAVSFCRNVVEDQSVRRFM